MVMFTGNAMIMHGGVIMCGCGGMQLEKSCLVCAAGKNGKGQKCDQQ